MLRQNTFFFSGTPEPSPHPSGTPEPKSGAPSGTPEPLPTTRTAAAGAAGTLDAGTPAPWSALGAEGCMPVMACHASTKFDVTPGLGNSPASPTNDHRTFSWITGEPFNEIHFMGLSSMKPSTSSFTATVAEAMSCGPSKPMACEPANMPMSLTLTSKKSSLATLSTTSMALIIGLMSRRTGNVQTGFPPPQPLTRSMIVGQETVIDY